MGEVTGDIILYQWQPIEQQVSGLWSYVKLGHFLGVAGVTKTV